MQSILKQGIHLALLLSLCMSIISCGQDTPVKPSPDEEVEKVREEIAALSDGATIHLYRLLQSEIALLKSKELQRVSLEVFSPMLSNVGNDIIGAEALADADAESAAQVKQKMLDHPENFDELFATLALKVTDLVFNFFDSLLFFGVAPSSEFTQIKEELGTITDGALTHLLTSVSTALEDILGEGMGEENASLRDALYEFMAGSAATDPSDEDLAKSVEMRGKIDNLPEMEIITLYLATFEEFFVRFLRKVVEMETSAG